VEARENPALRKEAGFQSVRWIRHEDFDGKRSGRLIHRRSDVGNLSVKGLIRERLDREIDSLICMNDVSKFFLVRNIELQWIHTQPRENWRIFAKILAPLDHSFCDRAGDRSPDHSIAHIFHGEGDGSPPILQADLQRSNVFY